MTFGWRAYGLGVMALGMVCLAWGDFTNALNLALIGVAWVVADSLAQARR